MKVRISLNYFVNDSRLMTLAINKIINAYIHAYRQRDRDRLGLKLD